MGKRTDRQTDGRTDGRTDGQTDRQTGIHTQQRHELFKVARAIQVRYVGQRKLPKGGLGHPRRRRPGQGAGAAILSLHRLCRSNKPANMAPCCPPPVPLRPRHEKSIRVCGAWQRNGTACSGETADARATAASSPPALVAYKAPTPTPDADARRSTA
jgi:hypothetical protein